MPKAPGISKEALEAAAKLPPPPPKSRELAEFFAPKPSTPVPEACVGLMGCPRVFHFGCGVVGKHSWVLKAV